MRLARRTVLKPKVGVFRPQAVQTLTKHLHTITRATTTASFTPHIHILRPTTVPLIRQYSTQTAVGDQTDCASCNTPFQTQNEDKPGYFVEPKDEEVELNNTFKKKDTDKFNALIERMSAEDLEFLAREQGLVSQGDVFDPSETKKGYTGKAMVSYKGPRLCTRCHEIRRNNVDERVPYVNDWNEAHQLKEEARQYNQELLDTISAESDTATVFLTCDIHEFPANVPVFLRKRRNLKLILTKAEGVVYVPQINSVNVQMWAASQMQSLGFKFAADDVHFFSAAREKDKGGYHQFSMYDLQRTENAFIVGYPNTGKTSLFNALQEGKFSKEANDLRYALPKDRREIKKGQNTSWHAGQTLKPVTKQTSFGKLTDMPAFRRANSPWNLVNPQKTSYITDKQILTENGRKFAGVDIHLKNVQIALNSGLFGVSATPATELLVWTSLPGERGLAKHTNSAKGHVVCKKDHRHDRAQYNLLDMGKADLPPLVELGTVTFDQDDGLGVEVAFEGAGFVRVKRTGKKYEQPKAVIWGFPGQVFAFRQPLCEIMLNNDVTVKGFFGMKDPNWRNNRRPVFGWTVDFVPTDNVEKFGGPDSSMYRVKEGAHTEFDLEQMCRAKKVGPKKTHRLLLMKEAGLLKKPGDNTEDEFISEEDLARMDRAKEKLRNKNPLSPKTTSFKKQPGLLWVKVGSSKNIKSWKWLHPEDARKYADNQDPDCMWFKQKFRGQTFQEVMAHWDKYGRIPVGRKPKAQGPQEKKIKLNKVKQGKSPEKKKRAKEQRAKEKKAKEKKEMKAKAKEMKASEE